MDRGASRPASSSCVLSKPLRHIEPASCHSAAARRANADTSATSAGGASRSVNSRSTSTRVGRTFPFSMRLTFDCDMLQRGKPVPGESGLLTQLPQRGGEFLSGLAELLGLECRAVTYPRNGTDSARAMRWYPGNGARSPSYSSRSICVPSSAYFIRTTVEWSNIQKLSTPARGFVRSVTSRMRMDRSLMAVVPPELKAQVVRGRTCHHMDAADRPAGHAVPADHRRPASSYGPGNRSPARNRENLSAS